MRGAGCLPLAAMLLMVACARKPPMPAPAAARPTVTRATLRLQTPADLDTHGDVVIPMNAIVHQGSLPGVFVLSPHGRARFRLIKIGATRDGRAQILSGLNGNETLVLPPFHGVYDGSPVHPLTTTRRGQHGSR
ncbi:hypothetical protein [Acidiferrobacter sp.]|uniref:hypothetical protein n=1 Tax=Acidiferrobacter sp. TaxID=1872107 RepID=UPI00260EF3AF|nr:hypothetical protein [Acidiferrobacter sp.]